MGWAGALRRRHGGATACQPASPPRRRQSLPPTVAPQLLPQALTALGCMEHRGACSADDISGDGAGIMTKIPWALLKQEMPGLNEETTGCAGGLCRARKARR